MKQPENWGAKLELDKQNTVEIAEIAAFFFLKFFHIPAQSNGTAGKRNYFANAFGQASSSNLPSATKAMCTAKTEGAIGLLGVQQHQAWKKHRGYKCRHNKSVARLKQHNRLSQCIQAVVDKGIHPQQWGQLTKVNVSCAIPFMKIKLMYYNSHVDLRQTISAHYRRPVGSLSCVKCTHYA